MATLLRNFHPYTHAPQRPARFVCGAVLALAGFALLTGQLLAALADSAFAVALRGGLLAAAATTLGALPVLAVRRIDGRWQRLVLAAGAGAMTVAVISLWQQTHSTSGGVSLTMLAGMAGGMLAMAALARALPHDTPHAVRDARALYMFVWALAVHNVPEGFALGVAAHAEDAATLVSFAIAAQNVPEGLLVALALASTGATRGMAVGVAIITGLVEPLMALAGAALGATAGMLPLTLAIAAGAMLHTVRHDLLPGALHGPQRLQALLACAAGAILLCSAEQIA